MPPSGAEGGGLLLRGKGLNAKSGCRIASLIANAQLINNTKTILISSPAFAFHAGGDDVREGSVW